MLLQLWTMVGTYIAIACAGVILVCVFVDNLPKYLQDDKKKARKEAARSLINTALHLKNKYQLILVPITIYSGLEQGFYGAEWTRVSLHGMDQDKLIYNGPG